MSILKAIIDGLVLKTINTGNISAMTATILESSRNDSQRREFCLSESRQIGSHVMDA